MLFRSIRSSLSSPALTAPPMAKRERERRTRRGTVPQAEHWLVTVAWRSETSRRIQKLSSPEVSSDHGGVKDLETRGRRPCERVEGSWGTGKARLSQLCGKCLHKELTGTDCLDGTVMCICLAISVNAADPHLITLCYRDYSSHSKIKYKSKLGIYDGHK